MSSRGMQIPSPDEINYHEACQVQRVERAFAIINASDVLAVIDDRLAQGSDEKAHPLYEMVQFYLDRTTSVDGGQLYDRCRQLVLAAIATCLDEMLAMGED